MKRDVEKDVLSQVLGNKSLRHFLQDPKYVDLMLDVIKSLLGYEVQLNEVQEVIEKVILDEIQESANEFVE